MIRHLQLVIVTILLALQLSCKIALPTHPSQEVAQTAVSDFLLNVNVIGGSENFGRLMNALTAVSPPADLQVHTYNSWVTPASELNIRYNGLTNKVMDNIQREVMKCDGISGVSIVRL